MAADHDEDLWLWTTTVAVELARRGRVAAGRACLMDGLREAETASRLGIGGAAELAEHYRRALRNFAIKFEGIRAGRRAAPAAVIGRGGRGAAQALD